MKHLQENDNAIENWFQEVGRDVAPCMPVAPVSTRSRRCEMRDDHNLETSRWQEDKVHETMGLDETSTQNERVAGTVAVKRQEQLGLASPFDSPKDKAQDEPFDSPKDKAQDENEIQSDQKPLTGTAKQLEDARTSESQC